MDAVICSYLNPRLARAKRRMLVAARNNVAVSAGDGDKPGYRTSTAKFVKITSDG